MNLKEQPALILIDIQKGMDDLDYYGGRRNNKMAEENAALLLAFWRQQSLPVVHIKHNSTHQASPLAPGKAGNAIKEAVAPLPQERLIEKQFHSAFIHTDLQQYLDHHRMHTLVIAGLTTDHCVSATTRMAGDLGYITYLVSDATATFDRVGPTGTKISAETIQEAELACLHGEFAMVIDTASVIQMLEN